MIKLTHVQKKSCKPYNYLLINKIASLKQQDTKLTAKIANGLKQLLY